MAITHFFAATIKGRMDEQCPAIQSAIDVVAQAWSGDRQRMIVALTTGFGSDTLFNDIMNGWAAADLKRATGIDRAGWLALFS